MTEESDDGDCWFESRPSGAGSDDFSSPPQLSATTGTINDDLLRRIAILEQALSQTGSQKGQALDQLSITVPQEVKEKILARKYVDMNVLLAKSFLDKPEDKGVTFMEDEQGRLVPKLVRKAKNDLSIDQWTSAFHVLMSVVLQQRPDMLQGMLAYAELIRGAARDNPGNAWSLYDQQFRSRLEADPTRPWGVIDNQLWLQLFCKPVTVVQGKAGPGDRKSETMTKEQGSRRGLCKYFNKDRGCMREQCVFAHKCAVCQSGSHSRVACPKKPSEAPSTDKESGQSFRSSGGQRAK